MVLPHTKTEDTLLENVFRLTEGINKMNAFVITGLQTDGAHHKQWFLERVLEINGMDLEQLRENLEEQGYSWEPGIPP